jgi:dipeptide transport system substrate-binding protein
LNVSATNPKAALLGVSFAALASFGASAKTFVYCSEGSPEGFDPGLYTAGTTFDAARIPFTTASWSQAGHD